MERIMQRISVAVIITSLCAAIIIPAVYRSRGYMDIGGEWILLGMIFAAVCRWKGEER